MNHDVMGLLARSMTCNSKSFAGIEMSEIMITALSSIKRSEVGAVFCVIK
jgi:hypothetical protein